MKDNPITKEWLYDTIEKVRREINKSNDPRKIRKLSQYLDRLEYMKRFGRLKPP